MGNVASKYGLTPQYADLQALYGQKQSDGLEILGFPANNFKRQEPGADEEIAAFCSTTYDVTSRSSAKSASRGPTSTALCRPYRRSADVVGDGPMRAKLAGFGIETGAPGEVLWNFEKFLISRDGEVVERFAPDITADDARLVAAVEREIAKPV